MLVIPRHLLNKASEECVCGIAVTQPVRLAFRQVDCKWCLIFKAVECATFRHCVIQASFSVANLRRQGLGWCTCEW